MSETVSDDCASELGIMAARGESVGPKTVALLLADRACRTAALREAAAVLDYTLLLGLSHRPACTGLRGAASDAGCCDFGEARNLAVAALAAVRAVIGEQT